MLRIGCVLVAVASFFFSVEANAGLVVVLSGTASEKMDLGFTVEPIGSTYGHAPLGHGKPKPVARSSVALSPGQSARTVRDAMAETPLSMWFNRVTVGARPAIYMELDGGVSEFWINMDGGSNSECVLVEPGYPGVTVGGITFTTWLTDLGPYPFIAEPTTLSGLDIIIVGLAAVGGIVFGRSKDRGVAA